MTSRDPLTLPKSRVVDVRPRPHEVAVIHLPPGVGARVHTTAGHEAATFTLVPDLDDMPLIAAVPGDRKLLGWGRAVTRYADLRSVRNGRHKLDRAIWRNAVALVERTPGAAHIRFEQRDHHGQHRWAAAGVRHAPANLGPCCPDCLRPVPTRYATCLYCADQVAVDRAGRTRPVESTPSL